MSIYTGTGTYNLGKQRPRPVVEVVDWLSIPGCFGVEVRLADGDQRKFGPYKNWLDASDAAVFLTKLGNALESR